MSQGAGFVNICVNFLDKERKNMITIIIDIVTYLQYNL